MSWWFFNPDYLDAGELNAGSLTLQVASDAVRALVAFAQSLWSVLIWVAVWAVVWLPIAAIGWLGYRRWRRV
ncbi:MAG: hypothetical protein ACP5RN_02465 [Armatimonadota bacterium]